MSGQILVILTGPPGAGKTTVGRLAAAEHNPSACIQSDWFYTTITHGFIRQWEPESDQQNRAIIRSAMAAAARFAEAGYFTMIEGVFGPWYLDLVRDELDGHRIVVHYVVLRPDLETSLKRATNRPVSERDKVHAPLVDEGPIRLIWELFSDLDAYESHVIDSTHLSASETARAVAEEVRHQRMTL